MQNFGIDGLLNAVQRDIDETFPSAIGYSDDFYSILYEYIDSYLVHNSDIERWAEELGLDPEDYTVGEMADEISAWVSDQISEPEGFVDY